MKYSKGFERDWSWYNKYKNDFIFDGSPNKEIVCSLKGKSSKEVFHKYDSEGKLIPTNEPELLSKIFKCKGSINFQIKQWAEDRAKGYLPKIEFDKIIEEYELLPWMIKAVENQKLKYYN